MLVFQISSRIVPQTGPVKKRPTGVSRWRYVALRLALGGLIISALATLLGRAGLSTLFFLLLPVVVSILTTRSYLYNSRIFLFRTCLALLFFSAVTGWELLTHSPRTDEIIVVTTTLALAVLFEPARNVVQAFLEQRFHLRNDEAIKAVEAYTSTLREEINLDKVREGLPNVVQQTMQPQVVSVWVRKAWWRPIIPCVRCSASLASRPCSRNMPMARHSSILYSASCKALPAKGGSKRTT